MALAAFHGFFWPQHEVPPDPEGGYRDLISFKELSYLREVRAYWNPDDYELYKKDEETDEQTLTPV